MMEKNKMQSEHAISLCIKYEITELFIITL